MQAWKQRLYEQYVSSGQAASRRHQGELRLGDYPQFVRVIRQSMPTDRTVSIADLGCGHGTLVFCLKSMGYANVRGVDVSEEQVALAHRLGVREVQHGEIGSFLKAARNSFDVLFLMDVIEHLERQELFDLLDLVHAALRPGGRIVIHAPNGAGLFGMRIRYGDMTHEQCFTERSMRQLLSTIGFEHVRTSEVRPLAHNAKGVIRRALWHLLTLRDRLLLAAETGVTRHILSQNLLTVAHKPGE